MDPARITLIVESAGAQLSSMAAIRGHDETAVNAVVALACQSDLVGLSQKPKFLPDPFRSALSRFTWGRSNLRDLSPIANIRSDMAPFLFIHGTADVIVPFRQSIGMCNTMLESGANCEVYPGEGRIARRPVLGGIW